MRLSRTMKALGAPMLAPALAATVLAAGPAFAAGSAASVVTVLSVAEPHARTLVLRGATEADRRVEVRAEIGGLVASEPLRAGAVAAAGDALCEIDPGERPANLAEAQANLRQAEVEHAAAVRLRDKGFTAETESLTKAAQLEAARAQLMRAEIAMGRLVMAAPFAGVLESDTAERGALLQEGSVCATLLSLDPIKLIGYAAETDVDSLRVGGAATARLATGRAVVGEIRFVARSADPETRTYRVEAVAPNPDLDIRDGMTAEITAELPATPAHFLPQSALTLNDGGALGVRLAEDGVARFHAVGIVAEARDGLWLSGLPDRAEVIVVGQEFVSDGQPVAPTRRDAGPEAPDDASTAPEAGADAADGPSPLAEARP